jgi:hypothetical protein
LVTSPAALCGAKKKALGKVCAYLRANAGRMRYDEYLAKGYPIASGVIEGACRHLVKASVRAGAEALRKEWAPTEASHEGVAVLAYAEEARPLVGQLETMAQELRRLVGGLALDKLQQPRELADDPACAEG